MVRLWLAAAGQKLSLNLAQFLLLNPVHAGLQFTEENIYLWEVA